MGYRNIEVNGQQWRFKVGKSYCDIRDPDGKGHRPMKSEITSDDIDPEFPDRVSVTPGDIKRWIEERRA